MTRTTNADPPQPEEPLRALRRIAETRAELDREEYHEVLRARASGVSWAGIAAVLGVSKQAVHRRFRGRPAGDALR